MKFSDKLEKILCSLPHVCPGTSSQIGHVPDQLRLYGIVDKKELPACFAVFSTILLYQTRPLPGLSFPAFKVCQQ